MTHKKLRRIAVAAVAALLLILPAPAANAQTLTVGAYTPGASLAGLESFETLAGRKQDYVLMFENWDYGISASYLNSFISRGTTPVITWEPFNRTLPAMIAGDYDSYIRAYAQNLKAASGTILLRPMHEMNGNWYPWGAGVNGNTPEQYKAAFRHIVDIFRAEGATNVKFVFSPNNEGLPNWNSEGIPLYFPGDAYVDFTAIDAYNFGTTASWSTWRSFNSLYSNAYQKLATSSAKPIMIGETASTELGGDKASWIREMFSAIKSAYPRIQTVTWFHMDKETDWRINSSSSSLAAYKDEMTNLNPASAPAPEPTPTPTPADSIAPTVQITSPSAGTRVRGTIKVIASASDNVGVKMTQLLIDGVLKAESTSATPTFYWDSRGATQGSHTITVKAADAAGNIGSSSRSVKVDNKLPRATLSSKLSTKISKKSKTIKLRVSASDFSGIKKVVFKVDGKVRSIDAKSAWGYNWNIRKTIKGRHAVSMTIYDGAGNAKTLSRKIQITS